MSTSESEIATGRGGEVGAGEFEIVLDGRPVPAAAGQSVGAALLAGGIRTWRTTRLRRRPRGLFCGIGICYDCLITVDGVANQRACLLPARPGMALTTTAPDAGPEAAGRTDG